MAFVVTEACVRCKYTDCVEACPVDCFHEGPNFMVIDPEVCIDCAACVDECPVSAIVDAADLPPGQDAIVALNAQLAAAWPVRTGKGTPLPDADRWAGETDKLQYLIRDAAQIE